jgi:hypothetical protein
MTKKKSSAALITIFNPKKSIFVLSGPCKRLISIVLNISDVFPRRVWLIDPDSYYFGEGFNDKDIWKVKVTKKLNTVFVEIINSGGDTISSFYNCLEKFNVYFPLYMGHSKEKTFYLLDASKWDVEL